MGKRVMFRISHRAALSVSLEHPEEINRPDLPECLGLWRFSDGGVAPTGIHPLGLGGRAYRLFSAALLQPLPSVVRRRFQTVHEVIGMLAIIAAVLFVLWLLGFTAFHVTSGFIHIVLVLAVISLLLHFFRGRAV